MSGDFSPLWRVFCKFSPPGGVGFFSATGDFFGVLHAKTRFVIGILSQISFVKVPMDAAKPKNFPPGGERVTAVGSVLSPTLQRHLYSHKARLATGTNHPARCTGLGGGDGITQKAHCAVCQGPACHSCARASNLRFGGRFDRVATRHRRGCCRCRQTASRRPRRAPPHSENRAQSCVETVCGVLFPSCPSYYPKRRGR